MTKDELKTLVGRAALEFVPRDQPIGVGTGSTVNKFIDALAGLRDRVAGVVSSSEETSARLRAIGVQVLDANEVQSLSVYIDGADEIDHSGHMIKGGGAALTGEKIVADLAKRFVCIADESKLVDVLGAYPLPVEVIPMALAQVSRRFEAMGGRPRRRDGVVTDNGHTIIDVHGLAITEPLAMEDEINQWPGVVTVGIFGRHRASVCLLGTARGVRRIDFVPAASST
jgi:ribose 5-phosphate isomerase A